MSSIGQYFDICAFWKENSAAVLWKAFVRVRAQYWFGMLVAAAVPTGAGVLNELEDCCAGLGVRCTKPVLAPPGVATLPKPRSQTNRNPLSDQL